MARFRQNIVKLLLHIFYLYLDLFGFTYVLKNLSYIYLFQSFGFNFLAMHQDSFPAKILLLIDKQTNKYLIAL